MELELLYPRPEILLELEKDFEKPLTFTYLTRWLDQINNIGIQRQYTYRQAFSKATQGLPKYCFVVLKREQPETAQTNFNRCCNANVQNINVRYLSNRYPFLDQNADFSTNQFAKFYNDYIEVAKALGHCSGLSMKEFRDLYTIFSIDLSAQKESNGGDLAVDILRRDVPANNNSEQNSRELTGFIVFFCEKTIRIEALKTLYRKSRHFVVARCFAKQLLFELQ